MSKISSALSKSTTGKPLGNIDERNVIRQFIDTKLLRHFFLSHFLRFLLLCFIPVLILGSLSIFITNQYIREGIASDNKQMLNQYSDFLQIVVGEMDSLSLSFDQDPKILMTLKEVLSTPHFTYEEREALFFLRNMIEVPANSKSYIHSIFIYYENPMDRFLSSREGLAVLPSYFDSAWYKTAASNPGQSEMFTAARYIQDFDIRNNAVRTITIVKPIAGGEGQIVVNLLPGYFEESFDTLRQFADQSIVVTDAEGRFIMHSEHSTGLLSPSDQALLSKAKGANQPVALTVGDRQVTLKHIPRLEWYLVTTVPKASLYEPVQSLTYITLLLSVCSVLISGLLAVWMTRKHYRQVYGIIRTLNSVDRHDAISTGSNGKANDIYELIIQNILDTFLQQKYLKIQLSERKYREQVLELKALQSQMNPHFLSNILHSIYWKSVELTKAPNPVSHIIEQLSDMMDYALRTENELVALEEELLYCKKYIEIQRTRHGEQLEVIWESIEGLEACKVLKLSLQPIIENSIHYGLERGHAKQLRVKVKFRLDNRVLKVTVLDNGPGIPPERLSDIDSRLTFEEDQTLHVGLANTYKRLGLKYGVNSKIRIVSRLNRGTAVTLYFPQA